MTFTERGDGTVEVKGTRFIPLEPVQPSSWRARLPVGYRTISIAGVHDPVMIEGMDAIVRQVQERGGPAAEEGGREGPGLLPRLRQGRRHGRGWRRGVLPFLPHELGIVIEVLADTQEQANTICSITRSTLLHYGYAGRISTAGNLAFPFSPSDIPMGQAFEFGMYHLMEVDDPAGLFVHESVQIGG